MGIMNKLVSAGAEQFLKSYINDFGKLKDLDINTDKKTIKIEAELLGEKETFILEVLNYEVVKQGGRTYLQINKIQSSRQWINIAFNKYFAGQKIEVPEKYSTWLKFID